MEKQIKRIAELHADIIKVLKESDKITKSMRESGKEVTKYRNFLKEVC